MKTFLCASILIAACSVMATAQAQEGPHGGGSPHAQSHGGGHSGGYHGASHARFHGDYHHFGPDDRMLWAGGGWRHAYHDGRWGWWWIVDGLWYWYDEPIYPYPYVVSSVIYAPPPPPVYRYRPPVVYYAPPPVVTGPPVVYTQAEPDPEPATAVAPPPRFRYFCPDRGYYPDVQTCPTDFVRQPIR